MKTNTFLTPCIFWRAPVGVRLWACGNELFFVILCTPNMLNSEYEF